MCEVALDLDLAANLFLHFALLQLRLVQYFEGADEPAAALFGEIYAPELAFTQRLANLEHAEVELFGFRGLLVERSVDGGRPGDGEYSFVGGSCILIAVLLGGLRGKGDFGDGGGFEGVGALELLEW